MHRARRPAATSTSRRINGQSTQHLLSGRIVKTSTQLNQREIRAVKNLEFERETRRLASLTNAQRHAEEAHLDLPDNDLFLDPLADVLEGNVRAEISNAGEDFAPEQALDGFKPQMEATASAYLDYSLRSKGGNLDVLDGHPDEMAINHYPLIVVDLFSSNGTEGADQNSLILALFDDLERIVDISVNFEATGKRKFWERGPIGHIENCWMANRHSLAAARSLRGKHKVGDSTYGPESSPLPSSTVGKLSPTEEDDSEEYRPSDSFPAPADLPLEPEMDATDVPITKKRKSEETSDQSDADTEPIRVKKKPGPKPKPKAAKAKGASDAEVARAKPAKKAVIKKKKKAADSDSEDVEVVPSATEIVFMIPEAISDGSQRVSISTMTSFDDAVELIHETIGCVSVARKPTLAYKLSTTAGKAPDINLRTGTDWDGLITDAVKKIKAKKDLSVSILVLPANYMLSLRSKSKPAVKKTSTDLDNNDSKGDDGDDTDVVDDEKKVMAELDSEYRKCVQCGPTHLCKIDRSGNHVHLTFPQHCAWAAYGTKKVTKTTPPEGELFSMFHRKAVTCPRLLKQNVSRR
ncbi:hypothetical protein B0H14DRAFT_2582386 [Mycena olivaceomarginata]|nr:hypothetical protein B0H14DRAFT_2582386 [Mycena olivaceomarginata]